MRWTLDSVQNQQSTGTLIAMYDKLTNILKIRLDREIQPIQSKIDGHLFDLFKKQIFFIGLVRIIQNCHN